MEKTDEELLQESRNGSTEAEELLLKRYTVVVKREVRFLFLVGAETEDLMQEAMIGLIKAIREFNPEEKASFHTYATSCIRNQIRSAIRAANRKKHQPLNEYLSFYTDSEEIDGQTLLQRFTSGREADPEQILIRKEEQKEQDERIRTSLSPMERKVALYYLEGMSYARIAEQLGKSERSVNNALTRIRRKLKQ